MRAGDVQALNQELLQHQIIGGLPLARFYPELEDCVLVCATEMSRKAHLDQFKKCADRVQEPALAGANGRAY
ncbi:MAG: hypothetical protein WKF37_15455 [Bryobacteraceae bacterium]